MRIALVGSTGQVGRRLEIFLRRVGHEVVGLSRANGWDMTVAGIEDPLTDRLAGTDAVVDVTNVISEDRDGTADFFTHVARNVGRAATRAKVERTVVLSIIGVDGLPDDAHYAGKYAQELAYRDHGPGVHVVRAAHFHQFAGMVVERGRDGERAQVPDFPVQPVHLDVVVRALSDAATGNLGVVSLDVAGPHVEQLPDLAARLVRARGDELDIVATPASPGLAAGACLAGPDALVSGPSFEEWLAIEHPARIN